MRIPLDRKSPKPVYLQIRDRIRHLIHSGAMQPGEKLPSIRSLAENVQVNKLTVIEAYGVLEADGLVSVRQGSGYFVSPAGIPQPASNSTFAPAQDVIIPERQGCAFYDVYATSMLAQAQDGFVDLSCGFPLPPESDDLKRIARRAIADIDTALFNYDLPQGRLVLRKQLAQMLVWQQGLEVSPEDLIITSGSKQGLFLAMHHYVKPGDWVIVESPTYHGAIAVLENLGARIIGIPMTAEGMNLELLEQYLRSHRPKLIYTISTLHNPTGITTSQRHRQQLLALAEQYECPILEDNAYEGLNFEPVPAPIKALDRHDLVTYIGTFSKTVMPGLRVGYMVVTGKHYRAIVERKLLNDLHGSTVSQAIISEYLASGHYRRRVNHLRTHNLQSRNAMLQALEQYFPAEISWTVPKGGLFLWAHLPEGLPMQMIQQEAIAQKVIVSDGSLFFPAQKGYPAMRLSFSHTPAAVERGIEVLGRLLKKYLG